MSFDFVRTSYPTIDSFVDDFTKPYSTRLSCFLVIGSIPTRIDPDLLLGGRPGFYDVVGKKR
jgi:hypothetical protein